MEYRTLGRSGLEMSAISLGCWATIGEQLDDEASTRLLTTAYDLGINFFDSAENYANGASEEALGRALQRLRWPRETYVVSSKVYWGTHAQSPNTWGLGRKHIIDACNTALRRLGVDYLDLYFCHKYDEKTPLEETVEVMSDLVRQGKVLYWGTSDFPSDKILTAHRIAEDHGYVPPKAEQTYYNILSRERVEVQYMPLNRELGLGITTYAPLACGLLTGRYDKGILAGGRLGRSEYAWLPEFLLGANQEEMLQRIRALNGLAREIGATPSQLALAWVLRNSAVASAISGASNEIQLSENVQAVNFISQLDDSVCSRIDELVGLAPGPETAEAEAVDPGGESHGVQG